MKKFGIAIFHVFTEKLLLADPIFEVAMKVELPERKES